MGQGFAYDQHHDNRMIWARIQGGQLRLGDAGDGTQVDAPNCQEPHQIYQLVCFEGQHVPARSLQAHRPGLEEGWREEGLALHSEPFPEAALTGGWEA